MADGNGNGDRDAGGGRKGTFGFLARKIGPVPIWLIIVAAVAAWYWYFHLGPGAAHATAARTAGNPGTPVDEEIFTVVAGQPGQRRVMVPNVVGQPYPQAAARIHAAGLVAQRSAPWVGVVRSEAPHAGTRVEPGTTVTLRGKPWPIPWHSTPAAAVPAVMAPEQTGPPGAQPADATAGTGASPAGTTRWRTSQ